VGAVMDWCSGGGHGLVQWGQSWTGAVGAVMD